MSSYTQSFFLLFDFIEQLSVLWCIKLVFNFFIEKLKNTGIHLLIFEYMCNII